MKPTFSLKWLFVGMAFVAVLLGWIADHRRLAHEQMAAYQRMMEKRWALEHLIWNNSPAARPTDVRFVGRSVGLTGGEIDERLASGLIGVCYPELELVNVAVRPEARAVLSQVYDLTVDGVVQHYRLKPFGSWGH
ncbi:MAG: hypothetical protein U0836_14410 [Pirellulales bacterium]